MAMTEIDLNESQLSDRPSDDVQVRAPEIHGEASREVTLLTTPERPAAADSDATSLSSENDNGSAQLVTRTDACSSSPKQDSQAASVNGEASASREKCKVDETEANYDAKSVVSELMSVKQQTSEVGAKLKDVEEQSISSKDSESTNYVEDLRETRIRELTNLCEKQAKELCDVRQRAEQQDAEARRYIAKLNEEHKKRMEQSNKLYEECRAEKDGMVVKYAQAEQRCIEAQRNAERCEQRVRDAQRNATANEQRVRQIQANQTRLQAQYDARCNEVQTLRSELERSRETVASTSNQLKWTAAKLKEEQEAHSLSRQRFDNAQKAIATQRDETALLKQKYDECRARLDELVAASLQRESDTVAKQEVPDANSVKRDSPAREGESSATPTDPTPTHTQVQHEGATNEGETVGKSVPTDAKKKESPARHAAPNLAAQVEELNVSSILLKEVDSLKRSVATLREENARLREFESRNEALRAENEKLMRRIGDLEAEVRRCETELGEMTRRCDAECTKRAEVEAQSRTIADARDELRERLVELESERVELTEKQSELLSSIERATGCATSLSARNAELSARLDAALSEAKREAERCQLAEARAADERAALEHEVNALRTQLTATTAELERTKSELELLRKTHEDVVDTYAATRRKLEANLKDVTKQLERLKRKVDTLESANATSASQQSVPTRQRANGEVKSGSSVKRNEQADSQAAWTNARTFDADGGLVQRLPRRTSPTKDGGDVIPSVDIVDAHEGDATTSPGSIPERMVLVNKIVRLQNQHAAKIERIEFYKDHVRQLNEELRKKTRLIQYYVLREEGGRLSTASALPIDPKKAHLAAKKPGILTQLYAQATGNSANQSDFMQLGEVNIKLQTLLEDTLVKNMTLKENLDTLSQEVARLTHDNNELRALLDKSDAFIRDRVTTLNLTTFEGHSHAGPTPPATSRTELRAAPSSNAKASNSNTAAASAAQQSGGHASQRKAVTQGAQAAASMGSGSGSGTYMRANLHAMSTE